MEKPEISVCIPTYNRLDYLPMTVQSVLDQKCDGFTYEIVVLDDGSTDGTEDWVKAQNYPIRYQWQENSGLAAARNRLIELARGKYITFLDSDDLLVNDALSRLYQSIGQRDDACAYGGYIRIDEHGNRLPTKQKRRPSGRIVQALFSSVIVHSCGSLFPRKVLIETGGFDENLRSCPDYIKYLQLSAKFDFYGLEDPTFLRRRHSGNMSQENSRSIKQELMLLKRFYFEELRETLVDREVARRRLAKEAYRVAKLASREGLDCQLVQDYCRESLRYRSGIKPLLLYLRQQFR
jgi:glycosyltransferase involved in cell wall biosynthesis